MFNKPVYTCTCNDGYEESSGICVEINECKSAPCENDAICTDLVDEYKCGSETSLESGVYFCPSGWEGERCHTNIDECTITENSPDSYPYVCGEHGTCIDSDGSYSGVKRSVGIYMWVVAT